MRAVHLLAENKDVQDKLREEVMAVWAQIEARGETEVTVGDLDSMVYLPAGMKVSQLQLEQCYSLTSISVNVTIAGDTSLPPNRLPPPTHGWERRHHPTLRTRKG